MKANSDVSGSPRRRLPRLSKTAIIAIFVLAGVLVLGGASVAYATFRYSHRYEGKILPGARIAGVPVGGMTAGDALRAVRQSIRPQLQREITLTWGDRSWEVTPKELGARSDVGAAVAAAVRASERASFLDHMQMALFDDRLGFERDVAITQPRGPARAFVEDIAGRVNKDPVDAAIDHSTGWVEIAPEQAGRAVRIKHTHRALMRSLRRGGAQVDVEVAVLEPEVTEDDFDKVLLVRIGENKLYFYEDGEITRSWRVATGLPEYMTPTGVFDVTLKRYMPTWVNPDPAGWGANMPASIPAGPSNPLGVRALNWSAPLIRFHGTSATYSLGYNASHGCVRMSNDDVVELYDLVDVGTPIVSVVAGRLKPLYASAPDPILVQDSAGDTAPSTDGQDG